MLLPIQILTIAVIFSQEFFYGKRIQTIYFLSVQKTKHELVFTKRERDCDLKVLYLFFLQESIQSTSNY